MSTRRKAARVPIGSTAWLVASGLLSCLLGMRASAWTECADDGAATSGEILARAPRFLLASNDGYKPVDVLRSPSLTRRITVSIQGATLRSALSEVASRGGLELLYTEGVTQLDAPARLHAADITVAAALTDLLIDAA